MFEVEQTSTILLQLHVAAWSQEKRTTDFHRLGHPNTSTRATTAYKWHIWPIWLVGVVASYERLRTGLTSDELKKKKKDTGPYKGPADCAVCKEIVNNIDKASHDLVRVTEWIVYVWSLRRIYQLSICSGLSLAIATCGLSSVRAHPIFDCSRQY